MFSISDFHSRGVRCQRERLHFHSRLVCIRNFGLVARRIVIRLASNIPVRQRMPLTVVSSSSNVAWRAEVCIWPMAPLGLARLYSRTTGSRAQEEIAANEP